MSSSAQELAIQTSQACKVSLNNRLGRWLAPIVLVGVDYIATIAALISAYYLRDTLLPFYFTSLQGLDIPERYLYFVMPLIYLGLISYERLYSKRLPFWQCAEIIFEICTYTSVIIIGLIYFTGVAKEISRIFIATSWFLSFVFLITTRYFTKRLLVSCGLWQKPVVIVGAGKTAELLAQSFADEPGMGYKIVGLVEDNPVNKVLTGKYPLLGNFANVEQAIVSSKVQDVFIAAPGLEREELLSLVYRIQPSVNNLTIVPNLFGMPLTNIEVETLFSQKAIMLKMRNNMAHFYNRVLKRSFDLFGSLIGGILISPILVIIAVLIYIDSPGNVIFAHRRIGADGKVFPCYKFRSMVTNAQEVLQEYLASNPAARAEWEKDFKLKDDPRITKIGKFLRKTSLDELPQLLNVIKGEMSLVGPRPIIDKEIPKYAHYIADYYLVRPGMTGYWQVSGRNDIDYDTRVQMDSWYVRNWSLWQDVVFLIKTVGVVLRRKGAY